MPDKPTSVSQSRPAAPAGGEGSMETQDAAIARLVVERGLATEAEVAKARELTSEKRDPAMTLAQALVEHGVITRHQAERLRADRSTSGLSNGIGSQQIPGYQMLGKLGAGAMATVYKAKQISLNRLVAIKVLPQKFSQDEAFIRRFYDEGRAAAQLNHPNIVQAFDVGHAGDYYYFVMEYIDGWTAHDDIDKLGKYPEAKALAIAIDIAKALGHAHHKGFIHRDVKPKNIMITQAGQAKLADMGLARALSDKEAAEAEKGKAFGTPYYIAPEQIQGEVNIDHRADVYSFGATLYHMVTGQVPFDGPTPTAVMYRHLRDELEPADRVNPALSQGISEIVEVCMAKAREKRYAKMDDLVADLEAVARGDAPTIARKAFNVATLVDIEAKATGATRQAPVGMIKPKLTDNPLFLPLVAGWALALILAVAVLVLIFV